MWCKENMCKTAVVSLLLTSSIYWTNVICESNDTSLEATSTQSTVGQCANGQFSSGKDCLECHCRSKDECVENIGCKGSGSCKVGYTGYPACQSEFPDPDHANLQISALTNDSLNFEISSAYIIDGWVYVLHCLSKNNSAESFNVVLSNSQPSNNVTSLISGGIYECQPVIEHESDRSIRGASITITVCPAELQLPQSDEIKVVATFQRSEFWSVEASWPKPLRWSCNNSAVDIKLQSVVVEYEYERQVDGQATSFAFHNLSLAFNTTYALLISGEERKTFTTPPLSLPVVRAIIHQDPVTHTTANVSLEKHLEGTVVPDYYRIIYGEKESGLTQNKIVDGIKDSVKIEGLSEGKTYYFTVQSVYYLKEEQYVQNSTNSTEYIVKECEAPSTAPAFPSDTSEIFPKSTVDGPVIMKFNYEGAKSNCDDLKYYVLWELVSAGGTSREECLNGECEINEVDKLNYYTNYTFWLRAKNDEGHKDSQPLVLQTPEGAPQKPTALSATVIKNVLNITWKPPEIANGMITRYEVVISREGQTSRESNTTEQHNFPFTGVYDGQYQIEVRAYTTTYGPFETICQTIEAIAPGLVSNLSATADMTTISLTWKDPVEHRGTITGYNCVCRGLVYVDGKKAERYTSTAVSPFKVVGQHANLSDLLPGVLYDCTVTANTSAGPGTAAPILVWTIPKKTIEAPRPPRVVAEKATETTITVFLPKATEDLPISIYFIGILPVKPQKREKRDLSSSLGFGVYNKSKIAQGKYITAVLTEHQVGKEFIIGDGSSTHTTFYSDNGQPYRKEYYNAPLTEGQTIRIYYGVQIRRGNETRETYRDHGQAVTVAPYSDPKKQTLIIAIMVTAIVAFLIMLIVIICLVMRWKTRLRFGPQMWTAELVPLQHQNGRGSSNEDLPPLEITAIKVQDLHTFVTVHESDIRKHYRQLPSGFIASVATAQDPEVRGKNRFGNILPYEHSRVKLPEIDGELFSDYINACYIDGYNKTKQYIAAQGPNMNTHADFWRMVWNEKCSCIVMVTRLVEEGKPKCDEYWPNDKETETYGDLAVANTSCEHWADFDMRTFQITEIETGSVLTCYHFHFLSWPDHGVPNFSTPFLLFRRKVKSAYDKPNPMVIHCSAGVGRTGTFIAIDYLLDQAATENKVHVFDCVQQMRNQRVSMVQTEAQYVYIYQALCEALSTDKFNRSAPEFQKNFVALQSAEEFSQEFETLAELAVPIDAEYFETGKEKENKTKNQSPDILPHDGHRPYIVSQPSGYGCYINAVFVNSYRARDFFLVTQCPLPHTVDDYLRLIYDQKVNTVLSLEQAILEEASNKKFGVYLPSDVSESLTTDLFTVTLNSINDTRADIIVRELTIVYKKALNKDPRTIRHFQANFWSDGDYSHHMADTFITLLEQIDRWKQVSPRGKASVAVQCRDGNERCGVFVSVWNAMDRLKTEQEVDVFHTVELARMVRPQFVTNEEFDLYANYK